MAIDDLLDEHEQSERVLAWLRSNGAGLVGGIVVGLGLILGWQWWQGRAAADAMKAGDAYQAMRSSLEASNIKRAQTQAASLADTPYAALAALDLAKAQVDAGERDAAIATLRGARSDNPGLQRILDQRRARLLLDAGKAADALALVDAADDSVGLEVRGDIQVAMDKPDAARQSYSDALARLDVASPARRLVELKLAAAGGAPDATKATTR